MGVVRTRKQKKGTKKLMKVRGSLVILVSSYIKEPRFDLLAQKSLSCLTCHKQLSDDGGLKTHMLTLELTRVPLPCLEARWDLTFRHGAG